MAGVMYVLNGGWRGRIQVLTVLVGCDDGADKARVWAVLERFSDRQVMRASKTHVNLSHPWFLNYRLYGNDQMHMGQLGAGTAAKLALNMLPMSTSLYPQLGLA